MNIIITGASSGIGYEAALHLLQSKQHYVLAIARNADKLKLLQTEATSPHLHILPFNIATGDYANELIPFIATTFCHIDVLINNAGLLINKPFTETTTDEANEMLQANYLAHLQMIQTVLPFMSSGTHILNIGSMGGYQGSIKFAGLSAYSASKAALHALTECLAAELSERNIKVNCLALGSAQTDMLQQAFPGYKSPVSAKEMGDYVAQFALNGHKLYNGKVLPVSVVTP